MRFRPSSRVRPAFLLPFLRFQPPERNLFLRGFFGDKLFFILFRVALVQFLFPQDAPQHFADHRLRQFLTEFDQARHLEGTSFWRQKATTSGTVRFALLRDDIRLDGFTTGAVINAHGNGFPNFGVRVEDFIDFTRIDVITTDDDQILFTVDNVEITFFIHVAISPVYSQPSRMVRAVSSGRFQ